MGLLECGSVAAPRIADGEKGATQLTVVEKEEGKLGSVLKADPAKIKEILAEDNLPPAPGTGLQWKIDSSVGYEGKQTYGSLWDVWRGLRLTCDLVILAEASSRSVVDLHESCRYGGCDVDRCGEAEVAGVELLSGVKNGTSTLFRQSNLIDLILRVNELKKDMNVNDLWNPPVTK